MCIPACYPVVRFLLLCLTNFSCQSNFEDGLYYRRMRIRRRMRFVGHIDYVVTYRLGRNGSR